MDTNTGFSFQSQVLNHLFGKDSSMDSSGALWLVRSAVAATVLIHLLTMVLKRRSAPGKKKTVFRRDPYASGEYMRPPFNKATPSESTRAMASKKVMEYVQNWSKEVGNTFILNQRYSDKGNWLVITGDVGLARQALGDYANVKSNASSRLQIGHNGGPDVATVEGPFWKHSRTAMQPAFSPLRMKKVMRDVVTNHLIDFSKKLDSWAEKGESFDMPNELITFMLSSVCESLYYYKMTNEDLNVYERAVVNLGFELKTTYMPLRNKIKYLLPTYRAASNSGKELVELGYKILKNFRAMEDKGEGRLINFIEANKNYKDDKEKVNDIIIMMFGSHDTTAYSMSHMFKQLAIHHSHQEKIHAESRSLPSEKCADSSPLLD